MATILALDLALNHSGWVFMREPKVTGNKLIMIAKDKFGVGDRSKLSLPEKLVFTAKNVLKIIKKYKPDIVVLEDTFTGPNAETTAKLNNVKGMALVVIYNGMGGQEPICATAQKVRSCIGIKSKEDVFNAYRSIYRVKGTFKEDNDLTDAVALAYYAYFTNHGLCVEKKKKDKRNKKK